MDLHKESSKNVLVVGALIAIIVVGFVLYTAMKDDSSQLATTMVKPTKEKVTCIFSGDDGRANHLCRNGQGGGCTGKTECIDERVAGRIGEEMQWASNCSDEKVKMTFSGQDQTVTFHCVKPPERVTQKITCKFSGDDGKKVHVCRVKGTEIGCRGEKECTLDIKRKVGDEIVLLNNCGDPVDVSISGQDQTVNVSCMKAPTFTKASWSCYDEYAVSASSNIDPLTERAWKANANNDCAGRCNDEKPRKCGVSSFQTGS